MGFTIPNATVAPVIDQAEPDSVDFQALGDRKTGVVSGCAVTAQTSPDQTVSVAAGEVVSNGTYFTVAPNAALSLGTGSGSPRFDLVVVTSAGALDVRTGTASSNPTFPTLTAGDVVLAAVYRTTGSGSTVASTQIIDKRVITPSNTVRFGAGTPNSASFNIGDIYINTTTSNITGQSQMWVKTGASAWENVAEYYQVTPRVQSGASDTILVSDIENVVEYSSACTISIPTSSDGNFPVGSTITLVKTSGTASAVVVSSGGSNVTVNSSLGLKLRDQWSTASLFKRSAGNWLLFGDLTT